MSDNESEYLAAGFDPSSLTVARLRNILLTNNVKYPASAKKSDLVALFNQEVAPKTGRLRAARARVRRTSKGITDMPSSQEGTVDGEDDEEDVESVAPSVASAKSTRRSSRRSTREPSESVTPQPPTPSTRRRTMKHPRLSDTEEEPDLDAIRPSVRKSRKSYVTPSVKVEKPAEPQTQTRPKLEESPFSSDNPFQSGSSPPAASEHRRRSANMTVERRKSSNSRRRTTANVDRPTPVQQDGIVVPSRKTFEVPVSRLQQPKVKEEPEKANVDAGEEFTPEEQLDLVRMNAVDGERDILPRRRQRVVRSRESPTLLFAPLITLLPIITAFLFFYRQETIATGYCGLSQPSLSPAIFKELPEYAEFLEPVLDVIRPPCQPCPQHATCFEGMEARCDPDFIMKPHPLTLNGVLPIPIPPTCEPDGEKARRVKAVADRGVEELRRRKAAHECGIPTSSISDSSTTKSKAITSVKVPSSSSMSAKELKTAVASKRRTAMTDEEFDELWRPALGDILGREEVTSSKDGTHLSTSSLARFPLTCSLRRSLRLTLVRHSRSISLLTFLACLTLYTRHLIHRTLASRARVPDLVATSLNRLATQAALHVRGEVPEPWLSVGQLRDDVLREIFDVGEREKLWVRVKSVVERNANVRASVREGRGGDVSRVWEWIGGLAGMIEGAPSGTSNSGGGRGGGKKRVSFYRGPDEGQGDGSEGKEMARQRNGAEEIRKWDEARPLY